MPHDIESIWTWLTGNPVAFGSIIAAILATSCNLLASWVLWTNGQASRKSAHQLELMRADLGKERAEFESNLRIKADLESRKLNHMFDVIAETQNCTRETIAQFRLMLHSSKNEKEEVFLPVFGATIAAYDKFSKSVQSVENVALIEDRKDLNEIKGNFLQMLIGMRLEEERRTGDQDFLRRVDGFDQDLTRIDSKLHRKYQRIMRSKNA